jgi:predicted ABC-type ATPase
LRGALRVEEFVNADPIAYGLSGLFPERVAITAGRVMIARLRALARLRADFAFETTLASRSFAPWLDELRTAGYQSHLAFLSLPSAELALERVAERVRLGGHHVPPDVVRRRFSGGLRNFFSIYRRRVDSWQVYDNSGFDLRPIAAGRFGGTVIVEDEASWSDLMARPR